MSDDAYFQDMVQVTKAGLGRDLDAVVIHGLVEAQKKLHLRMEELSDLYMKGVIQPKEYIDQFDLAMITMQVTGRHLLGDLDWKQCFGEFRAHTLADLTRIPKPRGPSLSLAETSSHDPHNTPEQPST